MSTRLATESVWTRLSDGLRGFLRRRVADEHAAEDLLQETFVRIHRNLSALTDADRLAAWVYQIARNVLTDYYRKTASGAGAAVPLPDDVPVADDGKGALRGGAAWLDELVRQLPDKYRDAVQWSELDGLSQQDVADRLRLSLPGAKSRIQRGRIMLKQALEQCCDFELDRRGNVVDYVPRPERTFCRNCDDLPGAGCV
jgi:RNA polymerase sigma-70 factor, ECF subfamily